MRDFKFRVWHQYGSKDLKSPGMLYDEKPGDCIVYWNQGQKIDDVMQYTGLKDAYSKEIYEKDIIETQNCYNDVMRGVVYYDVELAAFLVEYEYETHYLWESEVEVIGNIHEDPELLKEDYYRRVHGN